MPVQLPIQPLHNDPVWMNATPQSALGSLVSIDAGIFHGSGCLYGRFELKARVVPLPGLGPMGGRPVSIQGGFRQNTHSISLTSFEKRLAPASKWQACGPWCWKPNFSI